MPKLGPDDICKILEQTPLPRKLRQWLLVWEARKADIPLRHHMSCLRDFTDRFDWSFPSLFGSQLRHYRQKWPYLLEHYVGSHPLSYYKYLVGIYMASQGRNFGPVWDRVERKGFNAWSVAKAHQACLAISSLVEKHGFDWDRAVVEVVSKFDATQALSPRALRDHFEHTVPKNKYPRPKVTQLGSAQDFLFTAYTNYLKYSNLTLMYAATDRYLSAVEAHYKLSKAGKVKVSESIAKSRSSKVTPEVLLQRSERTAKDSENEPDLDLLLQSWTAPVIAAYEVLGLDYTGEIDVVVVQHRYKELARKHHPDLGGSTLMMMKVNHAKDTILAFATE